MNPKYFSQWLILLFALFFSLNLPAATATEQILDRMINAYGGTAALEKLSKPYHQIWDVNAVARNKKGTEQRDIELPGKLSVVLSYPGSIEKRILNGNLGVISYNNGSHTMVEGPRFNAMRLQRARLYHPYILRDMMADISYAEVGGKHRLTLSEGDITTDYYVDPESYLISLVVGKLQLQGMTMAFRTEYHDYNKVEGVMLPHREVKYAGAVNTAIVTLRETKFGLGK